jgi:predicted nucleotidyltransferase
MSRDRPAGSLDQSIAHPNIPPSVIRLLDELARDPQVEGLILFGSRAIGDHNERSDVDIAVCGKDISSRHWGEIREAAHQSATLYRLGLVHFDKNPEQLRERILSTGVSIYGGPETSR